MSSRAKRLSLSFLTICIWALCYVAVRYGSQYFTPLSMTFVRFTASALTVLCMMPFHKMTRLQLRHLPYFILAALFAYSFYCFCMAQGARTVTASVSSFIMALSPVLAPIFARLFLRERMRAMQWVSIGVSWSGVLILLFADGGFSLQADLLWVLFASLLFAIYNIIQRILLRSYDSFSITAYSSIIAAITLLPFAPAGLIELKAAPPVAIFIVVLLGAGSAIAYLFWAMALRLANKTVEVTNFMFLSPIMTTLFGFLLMGELPPLVTYLGGALMLLGLLLTNLDFTKKTEALPVEA